jgi:hypothetical protein
MLVLIISCSNLIYQWLFPWHVNIFINHLSNHNLERHYDFLSSFIFWHIIFFNYCTCFVVLGPTPSSDDSQNFLTLCSSILVAPRLACLELHINIFKVSWILFIASCQALPNLLSTNCLVSLWKMLWN